jgi:hypothetical protein
LSGIFGALLTGYFIYQNEHYFNKWIVNFVPDGLWAFSFTLYLLWIWNGRINKLNFSLIFLIPCLFELFQFLKIFPGTADIYDLLVYVMFSMFAVFIVKLSKKLELF